MRPDSSDRNIETPRPQGLPIGRIIVGLLAIAAIAYGLLGGGEPEPAPVQPAPPTVVTPAIPPEPIPQPAPDIPAPAPVPTLQPDSEPAQEEPVVPSVPPPTLETSDAELRERLAQASSSPLLAAIATTDNLVERGTASIDTLSRGGLLYKLLPIAAPKGKFAVIQSNGQLLLDPANYQRYDGYAQMIESLDTATLAATFHRFRPLLEETYASLGYRAEDFDNTLIRALDRILATPGVEGDIALVKSEAVYKYADPALEQRGELEKQLIRIGPENLARVKTQAQNLRSALLAGE